MGGSDTRRGELRATTGQRGGAPDEQAESPSAKGARSWTSCLRTQDPGDTLGKHSEAHSEQGPRLELNKILLVALCVPFLQKGYRPGRSFSTRGGDF